MDHHRILGLDGLRAFAVLAVIASHISHRFAGGWLGVDLFFVLSGYLITTLLVREQQITGRIALSAFYGRRALRLYPALLVMVAVCTAWPSLFGFEGTSGGYFATAAITLTYLTDLVLYFTGTDPGGLSHTWSLSVEEQFYLLWPAALVIAFRRGNNPLLWATAGAISSLVLLLTTGREDVIGNPVSYFAPHTRAYELLLGCVVGLWLSQRGPVRRRTGLVLLLIGASALGALFIFGSFVRAESLRPVMIAGAGLAAGALVTGVTCTQASRLTIALEVWPLRWLGKVSYGAYLYHWPIITLTKHYLGHSSVWLWLLALPFTVIFAGLSFRYIERPLAVRGRSWIIRNDTKRATRPPVSTYLHLATREADDSYTSREAAIIGKESS
jgi:peptidoglycan/LPS O-acetylase OafA/YrhL